MKKMRIKKKGIIALIATVLFGFSGFSQHGGDVIDGGGCTALTGLNGDFEDMTCGFFTHPTAGEGSIAAFQYLCLNNWINGNGSADVRKSAINPTTPEFGIPNEDDNIFAIMTSRTAFGDVPCYNDVIVLNVDLDPTKTYRLSFRHRLASFGDSPTIDPLNIDIQVSNDIENMTIHLGQALSNELILAPGSSSIYNETGFYAIEWTNVTTEPFQVDPGQNQIAFIPCNITSSVTAYWAIDDIVIEECDPCEASFVVSGNYYINTSTPSDISESDSCCTMGFKSVEWTVYEVFHGEEGLDYVTVKRFDSYNHHYEPTIGAYEFKVCLKIEDCSGCTSYTCSEYMPIPKEEKEVKGRGQLNQGDGENSNSRIKIRPNPNKGDFQIFIEEEDWQQDAELFITNLAGERVYTSTENSNRIAIQQGQLSSGMYIIVYKNTSTIITEKLIIE